LLTEIQRTAEDRAMNVAMGKELVTTYIRAGKSIEAISAIRGQITETRQQFRASSPELASDLAKAAATLLELEAVDEAESILRECLAIREQSKPDAWTTFNTKSMLGGALLHQGKKLLSGSPEAATEKFSESEQLLLDGYAGMKSREARMPSDAKPRLQEAVERLVDLYEVWNKPVELSKWRQQADETGIVPN
jgi:hypothetical protein